MERSLMTENVHQSFPPFSIVLHVLQYLNKLLTTSTSEIYQEVLLAQQREGSSK